MSEKNPIQVADRLFGALEYLAENGSRPLSDIADALGLNKSTTHRVLASLMHLGYIKQDNQNRYELTFKLAYLSGRMTDHVDIIGIVHPHLRSLMEMTNETVHFVEREGTECVYIDKVEATANNIRMVSKIGSRIPFYRSAVGKALVAGLSDTEVTDLWNSCEITKATSHTITSRSSFLKELRDVRERGFAIDNEENETGVRCIGCALDILGNSSRYAFSISVPVARMNEQRIEELAKMLIATKHAIEKG